MNLVINPEIKEILKDKGISLKDGIPILLGIYFNYKADYFPSDLIKKILSCKIVTVNYENSKTNIVWNVPVFEGQKTMDSFDWIKDFMDMFSKINTKRRGDRSYVVKYMKELFTNYPDIRKEEVLEATKQYLSEIENPIYLMKSHKFIKNIDGTPLLDRILYMRETKRNVNSNNSFRRII